MNNYQTAPIHRAQAYVT